jgi:hypothetical protein
MKHKILPTQVDPISSSSGADPKHPVIRTPFAPPTKGPRQTANIPPTSLCDPPKTMGRGMRRGLALVSPGAMGRGKAI